MGAPDLCDLPPEAGRGFYRQLLAATDTPLVEVHSEDRHIDGPAGALPVRIYRPQQDGKQRGIILYLHGGGFALGDIETYDRLCRALCQRSDQVLVAVDYRLAPEHPFPAAVDDCYAALQWVSNMAAALGADPQRLAVVGDSAGGNLAAVMALQSRRQHGPQVRYQALLYPVLSAIPESFPSYAKFGSNTVLSTRSAWHFHQLYHGHKAASQDERAAPLLAEDVSSLPPMLLLVGGCDILRDEGVAYAEKLAAAGNQVVLVEYAGLSHGFMSMAGAIDAADQALDQLASALRRALGPAHAKE